MNWDNERASFKYLVVSKVVVGDSVVPVLFIAL